MKYLKFSFIILIILFQSGNNLYAESIFTVNNIQVNKNSFKNKEELINIAFRKGFEKLNNKILLEKDYIKTKNPHVIIHCAGLVGGIQANIESPYLFLISRNVSNLI